VPPQRPQPLAVQTSDGDAINGNTTGPDGNKPIDGSEKGGLARATRAEDGHFL